MSKGKKRKMLARIDTKTGLVMVAIIAVAVLTFVEPSYAQSLKKAETGMTNFLKFFEGNFGNIIVAFAIIGAIFMILARRASLGAGVGVVVLAMILANAKTLADQLDKWFA